MTSMRVGESQGRILEFLKRRPSGTIPAMGKALGLSVETIRSHLRSLEGAGLVARVGHHRRGPGRPEVLYGLTESAGTLFPSGEGQLLRDLAAFLETEGHEILLRKFFDERLARRRTEVRERLQGLSGARRIEEVARILTEDGFMAEVATDDSGRPLLRLCHCPMRTIVDATQAPCRAELRFIREILGKELDRVSYIPSGAHSCSYAVREELMMPRAARRTSRPRENRPAARND